jgi:hypothetical protein
MLERSQGPKDAVVSSEQRRAKVMLPVLALSLVAASACTSTPSSTLAEAVGGTAQEKNTPQEPPSPTPSTSQGPMSTHQLLAELKSLELAFARGLCDQVLLRADVLKKALAQAPDSNIPLSTAVALSECAARHSPEDKAQAGRSLELLDRALANLTPPWDRSQLLSLKAARLESMGQREAALRVRKELDSLKHDQRQSQAANRVAMVRLDPRAAALTQTQRMTLLRLSELSLHDEGLFDALRAIDAELALAADVTPSTLAASSPDGWSNVLRELREDTLLRVEERFATDLGALVKLLQTSERAQALALVDKLMLTYPSVSYHRRLKATVAAFESSGAAMPLPGPSPTSEGALDSLDLTIEQRMAMASQSLASGRPDEAVAMLRSVAPSQRTAELKRKLAEAEAIHVRDLRLRVRDILQRAATRTSDGDRAGDLKQALEILNFIVQEYPSIDARKQIDRNIRSIEQNLSQINKNKDSAR